VTGRIRLESVTVAFDDKRALAGVDLEVDEGRFCALLGENGSGKSTLLKTVARVAEPGSGRVLYDGIPASSFSRRAYARRVAFLPQSVELVFPMTAIDLVLQGRVPHRGPWKLETSRDRRLAFQAMEACDVADLALRDVATLSGGERRRVFLARSLAQEAETWLLDEPTADLDPRHRLEFWDLLSRAHRDWKPTVLLVTHDLESAAELVDEVALLRGGRLVASGPVQNALTAETLRRTFGVDAECRVGADGSVSIGRLTLPPPGEPGSY
jgi:iron complex transport system ATP-binding protein